MKSVRTAAPVSFSKTDRDNDPPPLLALISPLKSIASTTLGSGSFAVDQSESQAFVIAVSCISA